jgi:hypothetical protein
MDKWDCSTSHQSPGDLGFNPNADGRTYNQSAAAAANGWQARR